MKSAILRIVLVLVVVSTLLGGQGVQPARAAGYFVTSLLDNTDNDGLCTLREAILAANNAPANADCGPGSPADDIITFSDSGTIVLTSNLPTIIAGQGALTIDAFGLDITISGNNIARVFTIDSGADVTLLHLTIANGNSSTGFGSGIRNFGTLSIQNSTIANNTALYGGAGLLHSGSGGLSITGSTFLGNTVTEGPGGAILLGGFSTVVVSNSAFLGNNASDSGGAIELAPDQSVNLTVYNSTFAYNTAPSGGAISNTGNTLAIYNSTFEGNKSTANGGAVTILRGGNVTAATAFVYNSIMSNNTPVDCYEDGAIDSVFLGSNNIIQTGSATCSAITSSTAFPDLLPLTGSPAYFPLRSTSPAIDAGNNGTCVTPDQRGAPRPKDGNGDSVATCDIGAFEFQPATYIVNTVNDNTTGGDGFCTLREAILAANNAPVNADCGPGSAADDIIDFRTSGTIRLGSMLPNIVSGQGRLHIRGNWDITISGDTNNDNVGNVGDVRVLWINSAAEVSIEALTIARGFTNAGDGAAIANFGTLAVEQVSFIANTALGGGAIANFPGAFVDVRKSTFLQNSASNSAGAIANYSGGKAIVSNSTFIENTTSVNGGALWNFGDLSVLNSTLSANSATSLGGGIFNGSTGKLTLKNTIVANSTGGGDCANAGDVRANNNLIEDTLSLACGLANGVNGNITGQDPNLGTLVNIPSYFLLNTGSPAIDAGDNAACAAPTVGGQSQNGRFRLNDGNADNVAVCDIGAVEYDIPPLVVSVVRHAPVDQLVTSGSSVTYRVTFSEDVSWVGTDDFRATLLSIPGATATVSAVNPVSDSIYDVVVDITPVRNASNRWNGAIRLDVISGLAPSVQDSNGSILAGLPYTDGQIYSIVREQTFNDVTPTYWAWSWIERLYYMGVTGGCGSGNYCPDNQVTRAQMAVFLLRSKYGGAYTPPAVGGSTGFGDVSTSYWAAAWIKQLAAEAITGGCGGGNYCPESPVTRAQMAVFLLRSKYGGAYTPPAVGGSTGFGDVSTSYWAAAWIKQLAAEGITGGCGGGNYCPESPVTRAQMAIFLIRTFNLP
ncbi:MAG: S-layer homology domain-containing protein [Anaerolineales bacterium]